MRGMLILIAAALVFFIGGLLLRKNAPTASLTLFILSAFVVVFFALAFSGVL